MERLSVHAAGNANISVGGGVPSGAITSSVQLSDTNFGNISGSITSTGSFGSLEVAGNSRLTGDLTIGGNMTFGDADTDSVSITADLTSNLTPNADSTYDVGSSSKNWRFGYIEQLSSTHVTASGNISGSITSTGSFGAVNVEGMSVSNLVDVSSSYSTRVSNLKTDSGSFSTRVTRNEATGSSLTSASSSFSTRVTRNEATGSSLSAASSSFSSRVTTNEGKATKGFTIAMSVAL